MKKFVFAILSVLSLSEAAFADCWMQCIKSPFGGCMGKVKMCNVTDSENAINSLTHDIGGAYDNLRNEWVNIYGRLPEELRMITDSYPITIVMLILPGTREYALFTAGLENYVGKQKSRAKDIQPFVDGSVEWKRTQALSGYRYLFALESIDLGNTDWSNPAEAIVPDHYSAPWKNFISCLEAANTFQEGNVCLKTLKVESIESAP